MYIAVHSKMNYKFHLLCKSTFTSWLNNIYLVESKTFKRHDTYRHIQDLMVFFLYFLSLVGSQQNLWQNVFLIPSVEF